MRVKDGMSGDSDITRIDLEFEDNSRLSQLYGEHDEHLARIENQLGVSLVSRSNRLTIAGPAPAVELARAAIDSLWRQIGKGREVTMAEVDAAMRMARGAAEPGPARGAPAGEVAVKTTRRTIQPRSPNQAAFMQAMNDFPLVFALGPAGTGKTYLAVAQAVAMMQAGAVDRLILSRPAVEAGEKLGFLPGDLREKVDPYLRPLYDALYDMLPADQVVKKLSVGEIEIAPLAFMRGRTLSNAFIILDEAQNTSPVQMKMALTRIGEGSRMVVAGDVSQIDLPKGTPSGLAEAITVLADVPETAFIHFTKADVIRHDLVSHIVRAYERHEQGGAE